MVHGLQDNASSFDNLIPLLPQHGFYYICVDLPGHGKSSHFPEGLFFSFVNYVESVRRIIDSMKLEKCIFIGHSLGGHIGIFLTSTFPEVIIKLIVIDAIFSAVIPDDMTYQKFGELLNDLFKLERRLKSNTAPDYSYDEAVQRLMTSRPIPITRKGAETLAKRALIKNKVGFRFSADQRFKVSIPNYFSFSQQKNFIDNIKPPVFIILAHDSLELSQYRDIKKTQTALFKDLKHGVFKMVDGNHNVHLDYPERIAPLISEFLLSENSHL